MALEDQIKKNQDAKSTQKLPETKNDSGSGSGPLATDTNKRTFKVQDRTPRVLEFVEKTEVITGDKNLPQTTKDTKDLIKDLNQTLITYVMSDGIQDDLTEDEVDGVIQSVLERKKLNNRKEDPRPATDKTFAIVAQSRLDNSRKKERKFNEKEISGMLIDVEKAFIRERQKSGDEISESTMFAIVNQEKDKMFSRPEQKKNAQTETKKTDTFKPIDPNDFSDEYKSDFISDSSEESIKIKQEIDELKKELADVLKEYDIQDQIETVKKGMPVKVNQDTLLKTAEDSKNKRELKEQTSKPTPVDLEETLKRVKQEKENKIKEQRAMAEVHDLIEELEKNPVSLEEVTSLVPKNKEEAKELAEEKEKIDKLQPIVNVAQHWEEKFLERQNRRLQEYIELSSVSHASKARLSRIGKDLALVTAAIAWDYLEPTNYLAKYIPFGDMLREVVFCNTVEAQMRRIDPNFNISGMSKFLGFIIPGVGSQTIEAVSGLAKSWWGVKEKKPDKNVGDMLKGLLYRNMDKIGNWVSLLYFKNFGEYLKK